MPVLDLQRRAQQTGRIRLGQRVLTGKTDRNGNPATRPVKLDTFRFTSPSKGAVEAAAEAHGGDAGPWDNGGRPEWEVITKVAEVMVAIPPGIDAISVWYEMWTGGGCQRRCDSRREQKSGGPCLCPHAEDPTNADEVAEMAKRRADMAKKDPRTACKLKTRVSLVLPDLPGIGVWRLDTGGFYAAGELLGQVAMMELCRERDVFLPARLRIDQRTEVTDGETRRYPVPVLELLATFRQVAMGELQSAGWAGQLPPAPGEPLKAIAAPDVPRPAATPDPGNGEGIRPAAGPGHPAEPVTDDEQQAAADRIADEARAATTDRQFKAIAAKAEALGDDAWICIDPGADEWQQLIEFVRDQYRDRARRTA